jgi:carboxyl-terminal processing protease
MFEGFDTITPCQRVLAHSDKNKRSRTQTMYKYFILLFIPSILVVGCDNDVTGPDAGDYLPSFGKVWDDYDQKYSYFIAKGIDWDSIRTVYEPLVQSGITYDYFTKNVLRGMLTELHDLHVSLKDRNGLQIPLYSRPPEINFRYDDAFYTRYLTSIVNTSTGMFKMAAINDSIGYILISSWSNQEDVNEFQQYFDNYQSVYEKQKGLIVDVRPNGGGNELLALYVAGRFSTGTNVYEYRKTRNGPRHDDFTNLQPASFSPYGSWQYTKPVIVLIGEACMSSNESFILMMSSLQNVTTIGDTTRGSSANPKEYGLADGTKYKISSWVAYKADRTILEDVGIFPDIVIDASQSIINGRDMVLERAIEMLE